MDRLAARRKKHVPCRFALENREHEGLGEEGVPVTALTVAQWEEVRPGEEGHSWQGQSWRKALRRAHCGKSQEVSVAGAAGSGSWQARRWEAGAAGLANFRQAQGVNSLAFSGQETQPYHAGLCHNSSPLPMPPAESSHRGCKHMA